MTRKTLERWVLEALRCKDKQYQLVEVCRTVAELERERCAKLAEKARFQGEEIPGPMAVAIAQAIRGLT